MDTTDLKKFGCVLKSVTPADMEKINAQTLTRLQEQDVFVFRIAAANDQPDRDNERFTVEALAGVAPLFVGKTVLFDHVWSAAKQTARIYDATTEENGDATRLVLSAYMLRGGEADEIIAAINGGILRETSVGCRMESAVCNICGTDRRKSFCDHVPGRAYDGQRCIIELGTPTDAYETSFVAVPSQPGAGVVKAYGGESAPLEPPKQPPELPRALALLALEALRF